MAQADVNSITGRYNETPLIIAAYYGTAKHREIANYLLSHGADIDAIAKSPIDTALITAIWKNNIKFAKLLLEKGANPLLSDVGLKEGYACKYAIQKKQAEIVPFIPNCCSLIEQNSHWIMDVGYFCPEIDTLSSQRCGSMPIADRVRLAGRFRGVQIASQGIVPKNRTQNLLIATQINAAKIALPSSGHSSIQNNL
ncbi:ankyrin repeat domain-containing protein [Salmonella enterica subsp. salamae serovar 4,12:e,n,x:1,6]|nr:ankyrin repeat domain-containing protein [Salmonella enterica subsp. salamae serovar 4,12:e,n,x:1,6]